MNFTSENWGFRDALGSNTEVQESQIVSSATKHGRG